MPIASRLKWFLDINRLRYEVVPQRSRTPRSDPGEPAAIPDARLAKSVMLRDDEGYVMAVIPASHGVAMDALNRQLHRKLDRARQRELRSLFYDCQPDAIPPAGAAYGIPTVIDDRLLEADDVYFESGDRGDLVHMTSEAFRDLNEGARHGPISSDS